MCMLVQLAFLHLGGNRLLGSVPESWSMLSRVSCCHEVLHLLSDVVGMTQPLHSL